MKWNGISSAMHSDDSNCINGIDAINGSSSSRTTARLPMPIAVVGMACRFPGNATNPEKLWELCVSGRDAWSPIPESRFDVKSLYHANREKPGRNHASGGYFLQEDVALFDAGFFNFTGDVARAMDPQLRLLLEVVYEATEDAGFPIERLAGPGPNTSVFTGVYTKDYHDLQTRDPETMPPSTLTGNYTAMFANRLSHFYDFQGASMSIDTGCSAALAALHMGCQSIHSGESDVSIIGASNAILNPDIYIAMSSLGMVGADGRCYAWDSRAQGYGRGEGVAVLILKSLDLALKDGDRVHTIIRNTGLNQDGKTTTITSPSMDAQIRLIRDCYQRASLNLSETGYVEAHMTGTQAGDVTEAESLARTFGMARAADDPILIGSVKTNVGHTEGVSGLAGIIKTVMAMKYKLIPPNLNYAIGNAKIPLKDWHLQVPTSVVPWPRDKPLRASINNFGYGGTNAHVILEGLPEKILNENGHCSNDEKDKDASRLYLISAQDPVTAKSMGRNLASHLRFQIEAKNAPSPADLAYTLSKRRSRLSWVAAVRAGNLSELADQLDDSATLKVAYVSNTKQLPRLGFVFNGQGAQWHAMGRELLHAYPEFATAVHRADVILRSYGADWSLNEELMYDVKSTRVSEIHLGQPITVALQICLVVLLRSWAIHPSAVTSHSSGEIAAAYAAGALSFEQALGVTYWRGELARTILDPDKSGVVGSMAAAALGADAAKKYVNKTSHGGSVVVACVNSPDSVTLSGDIHDLDEVIARVEADGLFARKLKVPLAYHSHHMLLMESAYIEKLRSIVPQRPEWLGHVAYTSPVTGGFITSPDVLTPEHYVRNLTSPVLFSQAFESMCFGTDGRSPARVDAIVEIGPHSTLAGSIRQILQGRKMAYVSCLKRGQDAIDTMQDLAGELLRLGYPVSLAAVNHDESNEATAGSFVPGLPTYPWNHSTSYWVESRVNKDIRHKKFPPHELLGIPVSGMTRPSWRNFLCLSDLPWVGDHRVDGVIVLPGAAYVSMAIEAVRLATDASERHTVGYRVQDIEFLNALIVPEVSLSSGGGVETHLSLHPCHKDEFRGWYEFDVRSLASNDVWVDNCRGIISAVLQPHEIEDAVVPDVESFLYAAGTRGSNGAEVRHMDGSALRAHVSEMGIEYGPAFQGLQDGWVSTAQNRAVTNLLIKALEASEDEESPAAITQPTCYVIHPTTLDCIVQATYTNLSPGTGRAFIVLPRSIRGMFVHRSLNRQAGEGFTIFSDLRNAHPKGFTSDVSVTNIDASGRKSVRLEMDNLYCQAIPRVNESAPEILISESRWELDLSNGFPATMRDSMRITLGEEEIDFEKKMIRASFYFMLDAVATLEKLGPEGWTSHGRALFNWMKTVVARGTSGQLAVGSKAWVRASKGVKQVLFDEIKTTSSGNLVVRIGRELVGMVRGEVASGELLGKEIEEAGDLGRLYYGSLPSLQIRSLKHLATLARLLAINHPGIKVLEIGAATGEAARAILETSAQGGNGGNLIDQYILTKVCPDLVENIRQKLVRWVNLLGFQEPDVDNDNATTSTNPATNSIDLIIAPMVLHASVELVEILRYVQKLLKPGGKLLLVTPTQNRLDTQLVLGTIPGWEQHGQEPVSAANLSYWNHHLRANGYRGVEFHIDDCEQLQYQCMSVIVTSPAEIQTELKLSPSIGVSIIIDPASVLLVPHKQLIAQLKKSVLDEMGIQSMVEHTNRVQSDENKICILATDMTDATTILDSLDETVFVKLRDVLSGSRGVLWLTSGGGAVDAPSPSSAQVRGLLRTLRQEDPNRPYVHLDLPETWPEECDRIVGFIIRVLQKIIDPKEIGGADLDWEYAVKDMVLHVPRVYPVHDENKEELDPGFLRPFQQTGQLLVWEQLTSGESHFVRSADSPANKVADGCVEIETRAFSLDHEVDIGEVLEDNDETSTRYGMAGIVTRLGCGTEASNLQIGDTVCGIVQGPFSSTAQAPWSSVVKIQDGQSLEDAASSLIACAAAYHALVYVARVQESERVAITYAPGNPYTEAALALAIQLGADILLVTTREAQAEANVLLNKYNLSPSRVLVHRNRKHFDQTMMTKTAAKGPDVIITHPESSLSTPLLWFAAENFAHFVRFIEFGTQSTRDANAAPLISRCAMYARVDIRKLAKSNGRLIREALEGGLRLVYNGSKRPSSSERFPITQLDKALKYVEQQRQNGHFGKAVIDAQAGDLVKVVSAGGLRGLRNKNATYLVVGGVGSIAGAIASWMISEGARNLLLISRNAETHPNVEPLELKAAKTGCLLLVNNCDVSSEEDLVGLLRQVKASMPPIRGVVHAAAVLEDTVFERMSFSQWQRAIKPKVTGSRNLHKHLPSDLSFFVLLSSITGVVGHPSQANYAAANTFEDALARHRVAAGLSAVSVGLPVVTGAGMVATDEEAQRRVEALGTISVSIEYVLRLVRDVIDRSGKAQSSRNAQLIVGLQPWSSLARDATIRRDRRFGTLRLAASSSSSSSIASPDNDIALNPTDLLVHAIRNGKRDGESGQEAKEKAAEALAAQLAAVFNVPVEGVDLGVTIAAHGVDSLVAVELRNWLATAVKAKLSIFDILQSVSLRELAGLVLKKSALFNP